MDPPPPPNADDALTEIERSLQAEGVDPAVDIDAEQDPEYDEEEEEEEEEDEEGTQARVLTLQDFDDNVKILAVPDLNADDVLVALEEVCDCCRQLSVTDPEGLAGRLFAQNPDFVALSQTLHNRHDAYVRVAVLKTFTAALTFAPTKDDARLQPAAFHKAVSLPAAVLASNVAQLTVASVAAEETKHAELAMACVAFFRAVFSVVVCGDGGVVGYAEAAEYVVAKGVFDAATKLLAVKAVRQSAKHVGSVLHLCALLVSEECGGRDGDRLSQAMERFSSRVAFQHFARLQDDPAYVRTLCLNEPDSNGQSISHAAFSLATLLHLAMRTQKARVALLQNCAAGETFHTQRISTTVGLLMRTAAVATEVHLGGGGGLHIACLCCKSLASLCTHSTTDGIDAAVLASALKGPMQRFASSCGMLLTHSTTEATQHTTVLAFLEVVKYLAHRPTDMYEGGRWEAARDTNADLFGVEYAPLLRRLVAALRVCVESDMQQRTAAEVIGGVVLPLRYFGLASRAELCGALEANGGVTLLQKVAAKFSLASVANRATALYVRALLCLAAGYEAGSASAGGASGPYSTAWSAEERHVLSLHNGEQSIVRCEVDHLEEALLRDTAAGKVQRVWRGARSRRAHNAVRATHTTLVVELARIAREHTHGARSVSSDEVLERCDIVVAFEDSWNAIRASCPEVTKERERYEVELRERTFQQVAILRQTNGFAEADRLGAEAFAQSLADLSAQEEEATLEVDAEASALTADASEQHPQTAPLLKALQARRERIVQQFTRRRVDLRRQHALQKEERLAAQNTTIDAYEQHVSDHKPHHLLCLEEELARGFGEWGRPWWQNKGIEASQRTSWWHLALHMNVLVLPAHCAHNAQRIEETEQHDFNSIATTFHNDTTRLQKLSCLANEACSRHATTSLCTIHRDVLLNESYTAHAMGVSFRSVTTTIFFAEETAGRHAVEGPAIEGLAHFVHEASEGALIMRQRLCRLVEEEEEERAAVAGAWQLGAEDRWGRFLARVRAGRLKETIAREAAERERVRNAESGLRLAILSDDVASQSEALAASARRTFCTNHDALTQEIDTEQSTLFLSYHTTFLSTRLLIGTQEKQGLEHFTRILLEQEEAQYFATLGDNFAEKGLFAAEQTERRVIRSEEKVCRDRNVVDDAFWEGYLAAKTTRHAKVEALSRDVLTEMESTAFSAMESSALSILTTVFASSYRHILCSSETRLRGDVEALSDDIYCEYGASELTARYVALLQSCLSQEVNERSTLEGSYQSDVQGFEREGVGLLHMALSAIGEEEARVVLVCAEGVAKVEAGETEGRRCVGEGCVEEEGGLLRSEGEGRAAVERLLQRQRVEDEEALARQTQLTQSRVTEMLDLRAQECDLRFATQMKLQAAAELRHRTAVTFLETNASLQLHLQLLTLHATYSPMCEIVPVEEQQRGHLWSGFIDVVHTDERRALLEERCVPGRMQMECECDADMAVLQAKHVEGRRSVAARLLQCVFRVTLSRMSFKGLRAARDDEEYAEEMQERHDFKVHRVLTIQRFVLCRRSVQCAKEVRVAQWAAHAACIQRRVRMFIAAQFIKRRIAQRAFARRKVFEREEAAAQRLQWQWRDYKAHIIAQENLFRTRRRRFHAFCATLIQSRWRGVAARRLAAQLRHSKLHAGAVQLQAFARARLASCVAWRHACALTISRFLRARASRVVHSSTERRIAAKVIQRAARVHGSKVCVAKLKAARNETQTRHHRFHEATCIQKVVRGVRARREVAALRERIKDAEEAQVARRKLALVCLLQRVGRGCVVRVARDAEYRSKSHACVVLQCLARSVRAHYDRDHRRRLADYTDYGLERYCAVRAVQKAGRGLQARTQAAERNRQTLERRTQERVAACVLARVVRAGTARVHLARTFIVAVAAALRIQCFARCASARTKMATRRESHARVTHAEMRAYSASIIQEYWRRHAGHRHLAATSIQAAFLKEREHVQHRLACRKAATHSRRGSLMAAQPTGMEVVLQLEGAEDRAALLNVVVNIPVPRHVCSAITGEEKLVRRAITDECVSHLVTELKTFTATLHDLDQVRLASKMASLQRQVLIEKRRIEQEWLECFREMNLRRRRVLTGRRRRAISRLSEVEALQRDKLLVDEYTSLEEAVLYHNQVVHRLRNPQAERRRTPSAPAAMPPCNPPSGLLMGNGHRSSAALQILKSYQLKAPQQGIGGGWDANISYAKCLREMDQRNQEYDRTNGLYGTEAEKCETGQPKRKAAAPIVQVHESSSPYFGPVKSDPQTLQHRHMKKIQLHSAERYGCLLHQRYVDATSFEGLTGAVAGDYLTAKRVESCGGVLSYVPDTVHQRYALCTYPTPPLVKIGCSEPGFNAIPSHDPSGLSDERLALLDLSNLNLTNQQVIMLFTALASTKSVGILKLVNSNVTDEAAPALCEALVANSTLFSLSLSKNVLITDTFVDHVLPAVAVHPTLQAVDLYGTSVSQLRRLELANVIPPVFASPPVVPHKTPAILPPLSTRGDLQAVDLSSVYSGTSAVMAQNAPLYPGRLETLDSWQRKSANVIHCSE